MEINGFRSRRTPCRETSCVMSILRCLCFPCVSTSISPKYRAALTWLVLVLASTVSGIVINHRYFTSSKAVLYPKEMRHLDISASIWCSKFIVYAAGTMNIYLPDSEPRLDTGQDAATRINFDSDLDIGPRQFRAIQVDIRKGSLLEIRICKLYPMWFLSKPLVGLVIIRGHDNYTAWKTHGNCRNSLLASISNKVQFNCTLIEKEAKRCYSRAIDRPTIRYSAEENGHYYIIFANLNTQFHADILVEYLALSVNRFNVEDAYLLCDKTLLCYVPSNRISHGLILENNNRSLSMLTATVNCVPKYDVFIAIIVLVPVVLGIIITCAIVKQARTANAAGRHNSRSNVFTISGTRTSVCAGRRHSVSSDSLSCPVTRETLVLSPPPYTEYTDAPPSYEDSIKENGEEHHS